MHHPDQRAGWSGLTPLVWVIGLLLMFWLEYTESIASGPDLAGMSLPKAVIVPLLMLIAVNLLVQRFAPTKALSQAELLYIYAMNKAAIGIGCLGMMQFLHPALVGWRCFGTAQNHWDSWWHWLPSWAVVNDPSAIKDYYAGRTTFFTAGHMQAWALPITIWTAFTFVLLFCFFCINTLLRRRAFAGTVADLLDAVPAARADVHPHPGRGGSAVGT